MPVQIKVLTNGALQEALEDLARLRISVFRDWPYLYDGTMDYETRYLARYAATSGAVIVGAYDGDRLVGAATGEPLAKEVIQFREPFEERGLDLKQIFYLAESVLDPAYRGQGLGHQFYDAREAHARALGFSRATFCAVVRPDDHPARPAGYVPLTDFWRKRGYAPLEGAVVYFPWKDIGDEEETEKPMQVWIKDL
ncbi:GNAT family N-acetyltransferase [Microvirga tunisiensis]|uniref:GNAT family N-acetyltransferase n=2 Tax=Pannonibacter tanglangensis TaxID=2750084 RepID=A0ABW9ZGZ5_9HYPH|nr:MULTISPECIES: GNAT family N-acetyltransferase [unclassified Pannonibacter]NBN63313.1 GNAT family N-acetyltransferase [Pannonibacter sp. XCT-34]NBN76952.1 GNAT family N-acetyltransferase [Pannonibacter sp. XCT-53]